MEYNFHWKNHITDYNTPKTSVKIILRVSKSILSYFEVKSHEDKYQRKIPLS